MEVSAAVRKALTLAVRRCGISLPAQTEFYDDLPFLKSMAEQVKAQNITGYEVGEQIIIDQLGLLGQLINNCNNLGEALQQTSQYAGLMGNFVEVDLPVSKGEMVIAYHFHPEILKHSILHLFMVGLELGVLINGIKQLSQRSVMPTRISTPFLKAHLPSALPDQFIVEEINENQTIVAYPVDVTLLPIAYSDSKLLQQFKELADLQLNQQETNWTDSVLTLINQEYKAVGHFPTLIEMAQRIGCSTRQLQKKLKQEDSSFQDLINKARMQLACVLLDQGYRVNEVAYKISFQSAEAFNKAFKHWTGTTPTSYQKRAQD